MGIVLSQLSLSTLFISEQKLPVNFYEDGNIGFLSQSGAYFITRISNSEKLPVKYGFCVGNQIDLKISTFLKYLFYDTSIAVAAVYIEGFGENEAAQFAKEAQKVIANGKNVIIYKGGRSVEGMSAAAGHTGAMAGNYTLQKKLLKSAGIHVVENFVSFNNMVSWLSCYPTSKKVFSSVGVMSNAGYETVSTADLLGTQKELGLDNILLKLSKKQKDILDETIVKSKLSGIVTSANPLDLTPMADETGYLNCIKTFSKFDNLDCLFIGVVPLTDRLETFDMDQAISIASSFAKSIKEISKQSNLPIGIVIDSGSLYDQYRALFQKVGLPIFNNTIEAFSCIRDLAQE